jgi:beta-glucanase (GH16 family)
MTAKVTTKQGTWPAFCGVPTDGSWPPELDTVEVLNANGNNKQNTTSIHTKDSSWPNKARALQPPPTYVGSDTATQNLAVPGDLDTAFHEWMSIVYSDFTATLFDNKIVMIWPTPSDFNKRMNLMVNLAVGGQGDWAGTPPNPNGDLGQMVIQKLEVWRFPPTYGQGSQPIPPDPGPDPQPPTVDIPAALASLNQAKASVNNAQGQLTNAAAQIDSAIKTLGG